jgi:hypothetical protein
VEDWDGFLASALQHETGAANRFAIRGRQLMESKAGSSSGAIDEFVAGWTRTSDIWSGQNEFFDVLALMGAHAELAALLEATRQVTEDDKACRVIERLLRIAFEDKRTEWGRIATSRVSLDGSRPPQPDMTKMAVRVLGELILWKIFPFLRRRQFKNAGKKKPRGMRKLEYWGVKGNAPELPEKLSDTQRTVLETLANQPVIWTFKTNLWTLFGLPDTPDGLRAFIKNH